jgi:hypothetical protein
MTAQATRLFALLASRDQRLRHLRRCPSLRAAFPAFPDKICCCQRASTIIATSTHETLEDTRFVSIQKCAATSPVFHEVGTIPRYNALIFTQNKTPDGSRKLPGPKAQNVATIQRSGCVARQFRRPRYLQPLRRAKTDPVAPPARQVQRHVLESSPQPQPRNKVTSAEKACLPYLSGTRTCRIAGTVGVSMSASTVEESWEEQLGDEVYRRLDIARGSV